MHWKSRFMLLALHVSLVIDHLPTVFTNMKGEFFFKTNLGNNSDF